MLRAPASQQIPQRCDLGDRNQRDAQQAAATQTTAEKKIGIGTRVELDATRLPAACGLDRFGLQPRLQAAAADPAATQLRRTEYQGRTGLGVGRTFGRDHEAERGGRAAVDRDNETFDHRAHAADAGIDRGGSVLRRQVDSVHRRQYRATRKVCSHRNRPREPGRARRAAGRDQ